MQRIIDNLSELVYVIDIETYQLLYVNFACIEQFGLTDWAGQPCYRLLHGLDSPCPFCNNRRLLEADGQDARLCWEYFNPIVKRHFQLRDKLLDWDGRLAKLEIANDITDLKRQSLALKDALRVENLLNRCARELMDLENVDNALNGVLRDVGEFLSCARVSVFQMTGSRMKRTHTWRAPGHPSGASSRSELSLEQAQRWLHTFEGGGRAAAFDPEPTEDGASGLTAYPLLSARQLVGYLCVGHHDPGREADLRALLPTVATLISTMLRSARLLDQDLLTGIYNRNRYIRDLDRGHALPMGVLYIDINGMKQINDDLGHVHGDGILRETAQILLELFPAGGCYRIGGDEFAVVLEGVTEQDFERGVSQLAYRFRQDMPFDASVGRCWSADEARVERLMSRADEQMYAVKKGFYRERASTKRYRQCLDEALELANPEVLSRRLDEGRFVVYYQPKFSVASSRITGAEALVRYLGEDGQIQSPAQFIPLLEEAGLIGTLDYYVFEQVCRRMDAWIQAGILPVPVAVNFSRVTLGRQAFVKRVREIRQACRVPNAMIEVEVTETIEAGDLDHFYKTLDELQREKFRIAIDDFGARFANLNLLTDVDFDVLKIDTHIIEKMKNTLRGNIGTKRENRVYALLETLLHFCRRLGIHTVVEGVELEEQLAILRGMECDDVQGFLFSRPVPEEVFLDRFLQPAAGRDPQIRGRQP